MEVTARAFSALACSVLVVMTCACAGSNQKPPLHPRVLTRQDVAAAFAHVGLHLQYIGRASGAKHNVDDFIYFNPGATFNSLEVEATPTIEPAADEQRTAGYHEDTQDHVVAPLAVVANVIVTLYPGAGRELRQKALHAVANLREQAAR